MAKKPKVQLPVGPLPALMHWLKSQEVQCLVVGGLAVAVLGRPRVTRDIDVLLLLPENRWSSFVEAGHEFGFVPRIPDLIALARKSRVLLIRHRPSGIDVDLILASMPFEEEVVARGKFVRAGRISIPVPTPEDLVVLKAVAHRDRDMIDIEGLLSAHPKLDLDHVRRWVREFAEAMDSPEIFDDLEQLLVRFRSRKRGRGKD